MVSISAYHKQRPIEIIPSVDKMNIHQVYNIEKSLPCRWTADEIGMFLEETHAQSMIAKMDDKPVGYALFQEHHGKIEIFRFVVTKGEHSHAAVEQMVSWFADRMVCRNRDMLDVKIPEVDVPMQNALSDLGALAQRHSKKNPIVASQDDYEMHYKPSLFQKQVLLQKSLLEVATKTEWKIVKMIDDQWQPVPLKEILAIKDMDKVVLQTTHKIKHPDKAIEYLRTIKPFEGVNIESSDRYITVACNPMDEPAKTKMRDQRKLEERQKPPDRQRDEAFRLASVLSPIIGPRSLLKAPPSQPQRQSR